MNKTSDLAGKTALISGSTSGIGAAIAQDLASHGMKIVLNGFGDQAEINTQLESLRAAGAPHVAHIHADLTKAGAARELVHETYRQLGAVDVLVNNAGMQYVASVRDFPTEKWDQIIALNLNAVFHLCAAVIPYMQEAGFGRIINISSAHGLVASPFKSAYVASKHGVIGFTKSLALELAEEQDITANSICPGYVRTPLVEGQIKDQASVHSLSEEAVVKDIILAAQPSKRFVEVDHIASAVRFLASDAGRSITGSALTLDGGWTAR